MDAKVNVHRHVITNVYLAAMMAALVNVLQVVDKAVQVLRLLRILLVQLSLGMLKQLLLHKLLTHIM